MNLRANTIFNKPGQLTDIIEPYETILSKADISLQKTHCFLVVLCSMAALDTSKLDSSAITFKQGTDSAGKMDTHMICKLENPLLEKFIKRLNELFPQADCPHVRLIRIQNDNAEIAFSNTLLTNNQFVLSFETVFTNLTEKDPLLVEKMQKASGNRHLTAEEEAQKLINIASKLEKTVEKQFIDNLNNLATTVQSHKTMEERKESYFALKQSMWKHKLNLSTQEAVESFTANEEKQIKRVASSLGLKKK